MSEILTDSENAETPDVAALVERIAGLEQAEKRNRLSRRRIRLHTILALFFMLTAVLASPSARVAAAQGFAITLQSLNARVTALEHAEAASTGTVSAFAGESAPTGYLLCDGNAVSRRTYAALFQAVGVSYGVGDGVNTFNLPDYRGLFLRMADGGSGRDPDAVSRVAMGLGGNAGNSVGSVQAEATKIPNSPFVTDTKGNHSHLNRGTGGVYYSDGNSGKGYPCMAGQTQGASSEVGAHFHSITFGGDAETRPKNAYVQYIIKY